MSRDLPESIQPIDQFSAKTPISPSLKSILKSLPLGEKLLIISRLVNPLQQDAEFIEILADLYSTEGRLSDDKEIQKVLSEAIPGFHPSIQPREFNNLIHAIIEDVWNSHDNSFKFEKIISFGDIAFDALPRVAIAQQNATFAYISSQVSNLNKDSIAISVRGASKLDPSQQLPAVKILSEGWSSLSGSDYDGELKALSRDITSSLELVPGFANPRHSLVFRELLETARRVERKGYNAGEDFLKHPNTIEEALPTILKGISQMDAHEQPTGFKYLLDTMAKKTLSNDKIQESLRASILTFHSQSQQDIASNHLNVRLQKLSQPSKRQPQDHGRASRI